MIQRLQTIWLLLAAVAAFLTLQFSFFSGNALDANQVKQFEYLTARHSIGLIIIAVVLGTTALISIFLYKNRKLQLRISVIGIIIAIANIALYYFEAKKFVEGNYDLTALIALVIPLLFIFAARSINKDESLVKSLDRLR